MDQRPIRVEREEVVLMVQSVKQSSVLWFFELGMRAWEVIPFRFSGISLQRVNFGFHLCC